MGLMMRKLAVALVFMGALGSNLANAVGLGELKLNSALNQKFEAEIKLLNVGDLSKNELLPNLANHKDFARAGVERVFFLTGMKFEVRFKKNGDAYIKVTTDTIVREPFLNFLVELHWPSGRILREYTVLLDPPIFSEAPASNVRQASAGSQDGSGSPKPNSKKKTEISVNRPSYESSRSKVTSETRTSSGTDGSPVRVKKNDTLWGIAKENRPSNEVTIRQTMLAIQRHNPQAFIRNNINLLKAGQILKIPNVSQIRALSATEVQEEIARQNEAWRGNRTIDATQEEDSAIHSEDNVEEPTPVPQGQLKLLTDDAPESADELAANASGASLEGDSDDDASESNNVSALSGELSDMDNGVSSNISSTDVDDLQGQIDSLKRLLTLKDQQLAILQAKTASTGGAFGTDQAAAGLSVTNQDTAALSTSNEGSVTASQSDSKQTNPSTPKQEQGLIATLLNNPIYIGLIILLILVGLVILGAVSRRRNEETEYPQDLQRAIGGNTQPDVQLPEDLESELEDDVTVEPAVQQKQPKQDSAALQNEAEIRKLVEEADIYIAYGRYERALEMLRPAVNKNPTNAILRLKLVEVFLATGDVAGLSQQEADLQAIGDDEALSKLEELKAETDVAKADAIDSGGDVEETEFDLADDDADNIEEQEKNTDLEEGIEFTLDDVGSDENEADVADDIASSVDDLDFLGDTDEAATKLELGRAYIDMADKDAAIEILNEVIDSGNEEQRDEAKKLLESIA